MTKVLVVDDHESMRESLERLFNESGDFCVVGGISCADHAVRMCGELSQALQTDGREMEILRLMCKHMTNKEIAAELYISEDTVKYHKKNMLAKTGFARSVDLAFYMISNGWINPLY